MYSPISKTPFLLLLVPLIQGIILQYFGCDIRWSIVAALLGSAIILFSFLLKKERGFSLRWSFVVGVFFLFSCFGGMSTYMKQKSLEYVVSDSVRTYIGYVTDSPQEKPNSIAYKIHLKNESVNIVCYLQNDSLHKPLSVGTEIAFQTQLQEFRNAGNPNEFDYVKYMYNQGFVATTYLSNYSWMVTGNAVNSLKIYALQVREAILTFYKSLGFEGDNLAVLSALTLGYQDTLSDDLIQGFRTTGTVHILSVSGLHVGVIFVIITFLLGFIPRHSRFYRARFVITILLLWAYSLVTGLPASVVRASFMLTVFCLANVFTNKKYNALNSLYVAAFFMLLYNPFWLFDIGFQLSFVSVLSILVLYKRMQNLHSFSNKYGHKVWQMFCLSCVAQLATFPLCLYYFGTFPTYFFIGNLIIVPMVVIITYSIGFLIIAYGVCTLLPSYSEIIYYVPVNIISFLLEAMNDIVRLLQLLPFALLEDMELSFIQLVLLSGIIILLLVTGIRHNSRSFILALSLLLISLSITLKNDLEEEYNQLVIYNRYHNTDIKLTIDGQTTSLDSLITSETNPMLEIGNTKILILNSKIDSNLYANELYKLDYIIVVNNLEHSLSSIDAFFEPANIILDGSLKNIVRKQLTKECENRNIPLYDVSKNGAFSIIF